MCGAVSGGIMAISLFTGRKKPEDSVLKTYETVRKLLATFESEFGSTNCRDLTKCDLGTDEGQAYFKENNLKEQCALYAQQATRITASLIEEHLCA